ncbi:hypothetical protein [Ralstonia chuxiongensis]|uniref:hypothetical protein n=1 Tax=Ralstonia chuxiongensis TaxID=2957504 RepID=UPI0028F5B046|nr:hypothetical protein [Ralstonia chuxiongensis]CAJ0783531.1 hypothetical protein R8510_05143 [Ralstonia chuxiongensis]
MKLRLRNISIEVAVNASVPPLMADFNVRFDKGPNSDFDGLRSMRGEEKSARIFCGREWGKVSARPILKYVQVMYLLEDMPESRRQIHCYIEVAEYQEGKIKLWA